MNRPATRLELGIAFVATLAIGVGVAATAVPAPARVAMIVAAALALLFLWRNRAAVGGRSTVEEDWNQAVLRGQVMRELSRARRTSSHVVLAAVSLPGDRDVVAAEVEMAGNVVRLHDLVGYDRQRNEINLVAVVPDGLAASAFLAKVTQTFGSDRVRSATSGAEAVSAVELIAQLDRRNTTSDVSTFARQSA